MEEVYKEKKNNTKKIVIIIISIILSISILIGLGFFVGKLMYPFKVMEEEKIVYIVKGEEAKTSFDVYNKKKQPLHFRTSFDQVKIDQQIPAASSSKVAVNLNQVNEDTTFSAKYDFLGTKKLNINVIVVEKDDIDLSNDTLNISNSKSKNATKYSPPKSEVIFNINATNKSKKPFKRNYDFKINKKVVQTSEADWTDNEDYYLTPLTFKHTFNKEGIYNLDIAGKKVKYVISKVYKAPKNGTILKSRSSGPGVLEIKNNYNNDVIVTLAFSKNPKVAQKKFYLKAKKSITINGIKNGNYYLFTKSGDSYSKITKDFLNTTSNQRTNKILAFKSTSNSYTKWKFKLGVQGGNFGLDNLDDNNMPN